MVGRRRDGSQLEKHSEDGTVFARALCTLMAKEPFQHIHQAPRIRSEAAVRVVAQAPASPAPQTPRHACQSKPQL